MRHIFVGADFGAVLAMGGDRSSLPGDRLGCFDADSNLALLTCAVLEREGTYP